MNFRLIQCFRNLAKANKAALITYITAGDPDENTSLKLLEALPKAGADIIEFGMPFTDPMADGPAIQAAGQRALKAGQTLRRTLNQVATFRQKNKITPIILMGYYNPIYVFGVENFVRQAKIAGVDGLIIVDLPPEEDQEMRIPANSHEIDLIRLATPTTDENRLPTVLAGTSGFIYYVSVTGVTGAKVPDYSKVRQAIIQIKQLSSLPVAVGFGVKTPQSAQKIAKFADGVVVGSAIVETIEHSLDINGRGSVDTITNVCRLVEQLAEGVRMARK